MYIFKTAYRHENGEVEGFVEESFTSARDAERLTIQKIVRKCYEIGKMFEADRVIKSKTMVTADELSIIEKDWETA